MKSKIILFQEWKGRYIHMKKYEERLITVRQELDGVSISVSFDESPPGDGCSQVRKMLLAAYENNPQNTDRLFERSVP